VTRDGADRTVEGKWAARIAIQQMDSEEILPTSAAGVEKVTDKGPHHASAARGVDRDG
jgi:hypothetical protein